MLRSSFGLILLNDLSQFVAHHGNFFLVYLHFTVRALSQYDVDVAKCVVLFREVHAEMGSATFFAKRRRPSSRFGNRQQIFQIQRCMPARIIYAISNSSGLINDFLLGITLGGNEDLILFSLREAEDYTIHAWYPDGSEAFTIILPLEPVAKTPEEIADEKAYMEGFFSQERFLFAVWDKESGAKLKNDIVSITVMANPVGRRTGYIAVDYSFANKEVCDNELAVSQK